MHDVSVITIQVSDPSSKIDVLETNGRTTWGSRFHISGAEGGLFVPFNLLTYTPIQKTYRGSIPKSRTIRLMIDTDLQVVDGSAKLVETKANCWPPAKASQTGFSISPNMPTTQTRAGSSE